MSAHLFSTTFLHKQNGRTPLADGELQRRAPSVFATHASHRTSERYTFIPTSEVVDNMRKEGWVPVDANQTKARTDDGIMFTKHMVRFQNENMRMKDGLFPEVVITNSHNGLSTYNLFAGFYRLVCSNGMIVGSNIIEPVRVRHKGDARDIIEGSYQIINEIPELVRVIDQMQSVQLDHVTALQFAEDALKIYPSRLALRAETIITPRRHEDNKRDLFTIFNVVQENLMKGGIEGVTANKRARRTKAISAVDKDLKLNRSLFDLADQYMKEAA